MRKLVLLVALALATPLAPARANRERPTTRALDPDDLPVVRALCGDQPVNASEATCAAPTLCEREPITVRAVYRGAFSSRDAKEAIVHFDDPCASHAQNFAGEALLRAEGDSWRVVSTVRRSMMSRGCTRFVGTPPAGDFLACQDEYHQSGGGTWGLLLITVRGDTIATTPLVSLDLPNVPPLTCPAGVAFETRPAGVEATDIDGDGRPDLRVGVTGVARSYHGDCEQILGDTDGEYMKIECSRRTTLEFRNTGAGLVPTPSAVKRLAEIRDGISWDPLESTCRHASLSIL